MEFGEAYPYVIVAYMGIWAILFGYVLYLVSRISRVEKEVGLLSRLAEKKEKRPN